MNTSYDIKADTVTVNGKTYDVERENCRDGMSELLTIEDFPGLEAHIGYEQYIEDFMNPRADVDGILGIMVTSHRDYILGGGKHDVQIGRDDDPFEIDCDACDNTGYVPAHSEHAADKADDGDEDGEVTCGKCGGEGIVRMSPVEWAKTVHGARVVLPLYLYDHSGISMRAGTFGTRPGYPYDCQWDSSMVGIIFDSTETREECGWEKKTDDEIEAELRQEIEIYDVYLRGDVRYYSVEDSETGYDDGCGGMLDLDSDAYVEDETFSSLARAVVDRLAEIDERAEWAARDTVTA